MQQVKFIKIILLVVVSMLLTANVYAEKKDTLVIGKVSVDLTKADYDALKLKAESVVAGLQQDGIEKTQVLLTKNIAEMIAAINAGKVDWVSDDLYIALLLAESVHAEVFTSKVVAVKKRSTVFFTRKSNNQESIDNIEKKIILFSHALSTNGYFVPFYELSNNSYTPRVYGTGDGTVSSDKKRIFYRFEADQSRMIQDVINNELNIGVLDNESYDALAKEIKNQFVIVHRTVAYPQTLELIRPELDPEIKIKLKDLLSKTMSPSTPPEMAMDNADGKRFERFIADGKDGYVYLRNIVRHKVVPDELNDIVKDSE